MNELQLDKYFDGAFMKFRYKAKHKDSKPCFSDAYNLLKFQLCPKWLDQEYAEGLCMAALMSCKIRANL